MSKKFVQKNIKLSLELDRYLSDRPDLIAKIPNGAYLIITVKGDAVFNKNSRSMVGERSKKVIEAQKEGSRWTLQAVAA